MFEEKIAVLSYCNQEKQKLYREFLFLSDENATQK